MVAQADHVINLLAYAIVHKPANIIIQANTIMRGLFIVSERIIYCKCHYV